MIKTVLFQFYRFFLKQVIQKWYSNRVIRIKAGAFGRVYCAGALVLRVCGSNRKLNGGNHGEDWF